MKNIFLLNMSVVILIFSFINSVNAQWVQTNGPFNVEIRALAVSGTNFFAGTANGVFLSTNNGTSWSQVLVNNGPAILSVYALAIIGTNIFAGRGNGVVLSKNNYTNWTQVVR
ncbi:MAG: beta propeller repeat protein [Ignavibacteriaceae bacterium]